MKYSQILYVFPEGKHKVFTMSYDDGRASDIRLVETMRRCGVKGTLNLNAGVAGTPWPETLSPETLVHLCGDDMEIANHGFTHPYWNHMPTELALMDFLENRRTLEKLTGKIIRGAAYPYGTYNKDVEELLRLSGVAYCRDIYATHALRESPRSGFADFPLEGITLHPTVHHDDEDAITLARTFTEKQLKRVRYIYYLWGHSFEFEEKNNWERLDEILSIVAGRDDVWYATNIEMVDYMNAAKSLQYDLDCTRVHNPSGTDVWLCVWYNKTEREYFCVPAGKTVELG